MPIIGRIRRILEPMGLGLACLGLASCAGGGASGSGAGAAPEGPIALCEIDRVPLTLEDGSHPYLEPQSVIRVESGFVVAGLPTYTWSPEDASERVSANEYFGARFALDGRATLIEKPIPGGIDRVRAASLGGDRWGAIFTEVSPDSLVGDAPLRALWYVEHDGERWVTAETLELPEEGTIDIWGSTELVWTGESLAWIAPLRPESLAVQYERRDDEWSHTIIPDVWIEVSTLAYDRNYGLLWAQFSEDPDLPEWQQSLRLYRRTDDWELMSRVVVLPEGGKVSSPSITPLQNGVTVTWRLEAGGAYALVGIDGKGGGAPVALDPTAIQVMPLRRNDRAPAWLVTSTLDPSSGEALRLLTPGSPLGSRRVGGVPYPFTAFATAMATSAEEILVLGAEYRPNLFLRSLLLRLSTSCT